MMPDKIEVILQARTPAIGELIRLCAEGKITFDDCCRQIAAMGYKTTSVYEMVRAAETKSHCHD